MSKDEAAIEAEIQAKNLNAPRLTPDHIDRQILAEQFHVFPGTTMTVCCLTLKNGFQVIGESAAASPENFDAEIGQKIARSNARDKIWALEGYVLKNKLSGL
jgi:Phage protein (N4 Gp49/phage Sf6 gene 66) family